MFFNSLVTKASRSVSFNFTRALISGLVLTGLGLALAAPEAQAEEKRGRETGLQLPRFVSLKSKSVNLRVGPGRKYAITWHYKKRGLPVEVIQEFDQWRRIKDSDGVTGWVLHSLLSSKRTAIVAPWEKTVSNTTSVQSTYYVDGKRRASGDSSTIARLQAGLLVNVDECEGSWCYVEAQNTQFWLNQSKLWGVYKNELLDG